jgi:hypothetical protein
MVWRVQNVVRQWGWLLPARMKTCRISRKGPWSPSHCAWCHDGNKRLQHFHEGSKSHKANLVLSNLPKDFVSRENKSAMLLVRPQLFSIIDRNVALPLFICELRATNPEMWCWSPTLMCLRQPVRDRSMTMKDSTEVCYLRVQPRCE